MRLLERQRRAEMLTRTARTTIRPAKTSIVTQAFVESGTRWTFPQALAAIDAHESGDFSQSGLLIDAMGRDDRISACMRTRVNAIVGANGLDFDILPPDGSDDDKLAAAVKLWWFDALPDAAQKQIVWDIVFAGFHLSRVHYDRTLREWRPVRLERWHIANVRFDRELERYVARVDGGEVVIEPGDPEWLLLLPGGENSWMSGAVRALGTAYIMRQFNWRDWSRFNEKHGMPVLAVREPSNADRDARKNFFAGMQKLGSTGIVRLPVNAQGEGFGLEYIEAKDRAYATFQTFRTDLDAAIAICLLGQNLSTEVKGGSYAAATAHDRVRLDYLASDVEVLSTALRDQLIKPWARFNVPGFVDEDAPWPTWDTTPPADKAQESATLKTFADAVTVLQKTGMPVDYAALAERVGVPIREGEDPNDVEPPAPAPAPAPAAAAPQNDAQQRGRGKRSPGKLAAQNPGFLAGQTYADDLVDNASSEPEGGMLVDELLALIDAGSDYEAVREAVLAHYDGRDPVELREMLEKVLTLADLAGQRAVLEDAEGDDDE